MTTSAASTPSTASTTSPPGLSSQSAQKALAYLRRAIEKMKALQAAERVLASLERVMLSRAPGKFDLIRLVTAINELNLALRSGEEDKVREAEATVHQELETAFQTLATRDAAIMPYHLRRFCEDDSTLLDLNALAALTSFYRALPPTEANRGKYDFVVTRLFSHPMPGCATRQRQLKINREQLTKRLTEMCVAWGETIVRDPADAPKISQFIEHFDAFIAEVKEIHQFEELVSRAFFQRVRDCKAQVGNWLYLPEVSAASIESNLIINNRFLTLLDIENEETQTVSPALQNLTDAFGDTYSNEPDEVSTILRELQASTQNDEAAQKRIARITSLLQIPIELEPPPEADAESALPLPPPPLVSEPDETAEALPELPFLPEPAVADEMDEQFQALAADPDNQPLVTAYLKASADARKLSLPSFLAPLPDGLHAELRSERKLRRVALSLILQADQITQTELNQDDDPIADRAARTETLLDQLGQMSDEIRDQIKVTAKYEQNANYDVLLDVYNQLMTARLRLQSAIVRRNSNEGASATRPTAASVRRSAKVNQAPASETKPPIPAQNPWRNRLLFAVVIALLLALGARFWTVKEPPPKDDADVVRLDRSQLPHGAFFTEAKLHQDLIICQVTTNWLELPADEQKAKLREVFNYGQERGAQRVILIAPKGTTVGFVTKDDVFVN
jgi:hypothetical protein